MPSARPHLPRPSSAVLLILLAVLGLLQPAAGGDASFQDFDRRATAGAALTVVFFGASLTWGANASDPQLTSYRALVAQRLEHDYPAAHFRFYDAAIGGTGSQLGAFRLDRDVLARKPDLVFVDFSANDDINSPEVETLCSYEAIIRRLVAEAQLPVVQLLFPFRWNIDGGTLAAMPRRTAHLAIAAAYHTGVGDVISALREGVANGAYTSAALWPFDGVHPGNAGYVQFAEVAYRALRTAITEGRRCIAPPAMLYAPTYLTVARVHLARLTPLPAGWSAGQPHLTSAFYDMLMSRWLDDECVAGWGGGTPSAPGAAPGEPAVQPLRLRFHGSMVMLFGESTLASGRYRATIDGSVVRDLAAKPVADFFDPGAFARSCNGNVHLVRVLATGLDAGSAHALVIQPLPEAGKAGELRLESVCVAGPGAQAVIEPAAP
jgi:lysophospholipase L1-like esterase